MVFLSAYSSLVCIEEGCKINYYLGYLFSRHQVRSSALRYQLHQELNKVRIRLRH